MLASALDAPRHYTLEAQLRDAQAEIARLKALLDQRLSGQFQDGVAWVNQRQAAALLNVSQPTISKWVAAGALQVIHVDGYKRPQIRRDSLRKPAPGKPGRKKGS